MSERTQEHFSEMTALAHPFSRTATRLSDAGVVLPNNIVLDLSLTTARQLTSLTCVSIVVTELAITAVFLANELNAAYVASVLRATYRGSKTVVAVRRDTAVATENAARAFGSRMLVTFGDPNAVGTYVFTAAPVQVDAACIVSAGSPDVVTGVGDYLVVTRDSVPQLVSNGVNIGKNGSYPDSLTVSADPDTARRIRRPCDAPCPVVPIYSVNGVVGVPAVDDVVTLTIRLA